MSYQKTFIDLALKHSALRFGDFTLKSGRQSPYFFNAGTFSTGLALKTLGECYAKAIITSGLQFDMLFGPAYKGIPLVCTTAMALSAQQDYPVCFNRKEAKDHGEGGQIIGAPLKGRVLVIDDVITAGTALRESFQLIQASGAQIAGVMVALDRQEKGQDQLSAIQELEKTFDIPVKSIITFADIREYVNHDPTWGSFAEPLQLYRQKYGI